MQIIYTQLTKDAQTKFYNHLDAFVKTKAKEPSALIALAYINIQTNAIEVDKLTESISNTARLHYSNRVSKAH